MPRSRNIKPGLFKNELLGEADPILTVLFCGLWTLADRDGKLEDRPKRIRAEIFPYRVLPDFNGYLTELEQLGFIDRYEVNGCTVIRVLSFSKHQNPHNTEKKSELPDRPINKGPEEITVKQPLNNDEITEEDVLIPDSLNLIPDSLIPDSLIPEVISSRGVNYADDFELFWKAYPSDRRGNKKRAFANWKKIPPTMYPLITDHVKRRVVESADWSSSKDRGYIIQAEGFLSGERWEDSWVPVVSYSEKTRQNIQNIMEVDLNG